ncbi:MAG: hypothetical protein KDE56_31140, partial [Anaerolineales bacterium]|nr:hypothetical protein [Anaerolineales bacterium]
MSKKYWVLLTVVLLSLGLTTSTVFAKSEARLISNLLPAPRLDQLNHYLVAQGYTASLEHKTETTLTDIKNDAGQNIQANIRITIVPYTKANSEPARIAYWEGTWESRVYSGSLATIGEKKLMFANARGVQQVKSFNNLKSYVQIPLYAFSGSTPWGMTDTEFDEETSSIPNSD